MSGQDDFPVETPAYFRLYLSYTVLASTVESYGMKQKFSGAKRLLSDCAGEQLTIQTEHSQPRLMRGDIQTVAGFEGIKTAENSQHSATETTIKLVTESEELRAKVVVRVLTGSPAGVIELVEVSQTDHWGSGVGTALHESAVDYLETVVGVERIYSKIENTRMMSANIETGFSQLEGLWYRRS